MSAAAQITKLLRELNARVPILREISSDKDYEYALALMEEFLKDYDTNLVAIEALSNAIARYEAEALYFSEFNQRRLDGDPAVATLQILMEQHNLKAADFKNEIGGKSMVSEVLSGDKQLTRKHIGSLSTRFGISPALFF